MTLHERLNRRSGNIKPCIATLIDNTINAKKATELACKKTVSSILRPLKLNTCFIPKSLFYINPPKNLFNEFQMQKSTKSNICLLKQIHEFVSCDEYYL